MGICCGVEEKIKIMNEIKSDINNHILVIYSKVGCPKCVRTKSLLHSIRAEPKIIEISSLIMKGILKEITQQRSFPYVFVKGKFVDTRKLEIEIKNGNLTNLITEQKNHPTVEG